MRHYKIVGIVLGIGMMLSACETAGVASPKSTIAQNENETTKSEIIEVETKTATESVVEAQNVELNSDIILEAVKAHSVDSNPGLLDNLANNVGWWIKDESDTECHVIVRSYTGAYINYYVDKNTGMTRITEYMPMIMEEGQEEDTGITFNIRDWIR